jgi:hypothetical protein
MMLAGGHWGSCDGKIANPGMMFNLNIAVALHRLQEPIKDSAGFAVLSTDAIGGPLLLICPALHTAACISAQ